MPPRLGLSRILIVLLVLRVVAAPVSARPDHPKGSADARFVLRVCAWPAQRFVLSSSSTALVPSFRGTGRGLPARPSLKPPADLAGPRSLSRLRRLLSADSDPVSLRVVDGLRC